jgi:hypothetical protein
MRSLEQESLWVRYKTEVWSDTSEQSAAIHNTMRVLRSIHNNKTPLAYVSGPITTGKHFYDMKLSGADVGLSEIINHNYLLGHQLTKEIESRRPCPVLFPADLVPARQKWSQTHFQALWLSIIAEKCTEVHMSPEWAYSSGCAEEFVHTMQLRLGVPESNNLVFFNTKEPEAEARERMRNIAVYDHEGKTLTIEDGITEIETARDWLSHRLFTVERLDECLRLLRWTQQQLAYGFYQ